MKISLFAAIVFATSCTSTVWFPKSKETEKLRSAEELLLTLKDYRGMQSDMISAAKRSDSEASKRYDEHRAKLKQLFLLIETKRSIFDYPRLITYGYATWQPWDRRYRFRLGIRDRWGEGKASSEFYLYTDTNGVIVEKKPVDYLW